MAHFEVYNGEIQDYCGIVAALACEAGILCLPRLLPRRH